jgi:hypothetical protein
MTRDTQPVTDPPEAERREPTLSEQIAQQLGGVRGVVESSVPVLVFVIVNIRWFRPALYAALAAAVALALYRLARRETIRHAVNGLFGVGIGVLFALRTGSSKDFYLPGIIISFGYGLAMLASVAVRRPLVGWIWSLVVAGGSMAWRDHPGMVRLFSRLTVLWALTYLAKVAIQTWIFNNTAADDPGTALGIARILLGAPPYALLLGFTVWSVRRLSAENPATAAG